MLHWRRKRYEALEAEEAQGKSFWTYDFFRESRVKVWHLFGVIAAHDGALTDGVEKFLHWASADRSQKGDAHSASEASISDAWLTVHVVGALVLRLLGDAEKRGA